MLINADSRFIPLADKSVQCVVTSPPYYGLRDYQTGRWEGGDETCKHILEKKDGGERSSRTAAPGRGGVFKDTCGLCGAIRIDRQIGLEQTPEDYVNGLVDVMREVWRVLRDDGVLWLNLGDSYFGSQQTGGTNSISGRGHSQPHAEHKRVSSNLKPKDLIGIPWRAALALQGDGWYLRSDIIWAKPNPIPESVRDRCTKSHEYIFLLTKSPRYYYDSIAISEPLAGSTIERTKYDWGSPGKKSAGYQEINGLNREGKYTAPKSGRRNKRDVWFVGSSPYRGAHFATFPTELVEPMVLAGCPKSGIVLDPFCGSGTVGEVCRNLNRRFVGIDLSLKYLEENALPRAEGKNTVDSIMELPIFKELK